MYLFASAIVFAVFALNVAIGSITGKILLGDVGEMLVLVAASTLFVVAILKKEADRKNKNGG